MKLTKGDLNLLIDVVNEVDSFAKHSFDNLVEQLIKVRHKDERDFLLRMKESARAKRERLVEIRTKLKDELGT